MRNERRIGLISDTHGLLRPAALAALAGVEQILHAGDVGGSAILDGLRNIAPVTAVRGNTDTSPWGRTLPHSAELLIDSVRLLVIHDLAEFAQPQAVQGYRVVVSGHTHRQRVEERGGVLFVNPGAAGPRRFTLPLSVAILTVRGPELSVELVALDERSTSAT
ncbi:MAG: metallophosphoesterase family protein [Roseiflexaceae bacterium]|nr:metallophosphoesterase family protein [Roseiflexaceae bacterium]